MIIETYRGESFTITEPVKVTFGKGTGTMWFIKSVDGSTIIGSGNPARVRSLARDINRHLERGEEKITIESIAIVSVG